MFFCKNTSLLTGGSSTHKSSAGAQEIFKSSWRLSDIVRCTYTNFKQKSSGARPMCANAVRAPSGHHTVPCRCQFTLIDPTKRRTGAVEFLVGPKLHRAPYDV